MSKTQKPHATMYVAIHNLLFSAATERRMDVKISRNVLKDVVVHYGRDLEKLHDHQKGEVSLTKRIAGLAFWIRRLKPISIAYPKGHRHEDDEIQDANEQIALTIAMKLLLKTACHKKHLSVMKDLPESGRAVALSSFLTMYWSNHEGINYTNFIYSFRYRNFSPHHISLLFDSILTGFALSVHPEHSLSSVTS
jgi:hypothetical protein